MKVTGPKLAKCDVCGTVTSEMREHDSTVDGYCDRAKTFKLNRTMEALRNASLEDMMGWS